MYCDDFTLGEQLFATICFLHRPCNTINFALSIIGPAHSFDIARSISPSAGGGHFSFHDTVSYHSNRKSTTYKFGETSDKYIHISGKFSDNHTYKFANSNADKAHQ